MKILFLPASSPHYFKTVQISALALLKMVMHARSGGRLEVMGLMLGKIDGPNMVVMDTFALPVEGTETRVNAQAAAYEYMSTYIEAAKRVCMCVHNVRVCCTLRRKGATVVDVRFPHVTIWYPELANCPLKW